MLSEEPPDNPSSIDPPGPPRQRAEDAQPPVQRIPGYTSEELARHSVFNELNIFPGRPNEVIQTDWSCSQCGYNLRGLMTGEKCPECGSIELFRPPPPGQISYATWYAERKKNASNLKAFLLLVVIVIAGGPFAVVGTFLSQMIPTFLGPIVVGPSIEEIMKISLILLVVETRPFLIRRQDEITFAALAGALGFAFIENLLYLKVYIPNPTLELEIWRWTVCTMLHVTCTLIASRGVIAVWRATDEQMRIPMVQLMYRPILIAIVVHGSYNAIVTLVGIAGFDF
ncbi:MAG: PrsW family intramembrane metalloprotease [Phycisphaerales bacterium]|nr:PrsW family intramembrane metalloprotease [Phycisphaerales bacterium]MCB9864929.1 PrsW family intramembrane metalloprotease [Phycisphaerales bacterium]